MTPFIPAHRRKRDPLDRAQLAPRKLAAKPDCVCGAPWRRHAPKDGDGRGYCLDPDCACLAWRPAEVKR